MTPPSRADSDRFERNPQVAWRVVEGRVLVVTPKSNELHTLDEVGSRIWQLLEEGATFAALVETICREYEVEAEQCRRDTTAFLASLAEKGLVRRA